MTTANATPSCQGLFLCRVLGTFDHAFLLATRRVQIDDQRYLTLIVWFR